MEQLSRPVYPYLIPDQDVSHAVHAHMAVNELVAVIAVVVIAPLEVCKPPLQLGNLVINHFASEIMSK